MPTPTKGARLGGSAAHQRIILANLASQLFEHDRIVTTEAKARALRPLAEKLITKAKRGDIHARRTVLTTVRDKGVVHKLFTEIAPIFADREGGYTRITKVGPRKGDNAPMAMIELVTETVEQSRANNAKASAPVRSSARPGAGAAGAPSRQGASEQSPNATQPVAAPPVAATTDGPAVDEPAADDTGTDQGPAEELVSDTETVQESTETEFAPSDDTSAEEAGAAPEDGAVKA